MSGFHELSKNLRLKDQRYQFIGSGNEHDEVSFPPRPNIEQRSPEHYDLWQDETAASDVDEEALNELMAAAVLA